MHQNYLNLYFRKAFQEYNKTQEGSSITKWLNILKKRLGKTFSKEDQDYWDILFEVNIRGKSLEDIMQESSQIDPEKEKWIKNELNGVFQKPKVMVQLGKK